MSIIYKGLNPKTDYGLCILTIKGELITANGKHIQAIQIPKGHGRLIDGDKFKETMGDTNMDIYTDEVKEHIDDAPTILEAEGQNGEMDI